MITVVSDVHLGYGQSNRDDFLRFLDYCDSADIDHLVLLGDIIDFWRRFPAGAVVENAEIFAKLANLNVKNIHYVVGNHDYCLLGLNENYGGNYPFSVSKSLRLENGGKKYYFTHGYELEVLQSSLYPLSIKEYEEFSEKMCYTEDVMKQGESSLPKITLNIIGFAEEMLGWVIFRVSNSLEKRRWGSILRATEIMKKPPHKRENISKIYDSAVSKAAYMLLGMKPNENLVFGHTHSPFINREGTVANTGSWVNELSPQNYYVEISEGKMELKIFK